MQVALVPAVAEAGLPGVAGAEAVQILRGSLQEPALQVDAILNQNAKLMQVAAQ